MTRFATLAAAMLLGTTGTYAQQWETLVPIDGISSNDAIAAVDEMFADPALEGGKVTLYAADFGVENGSILLVADYDSYAERAGRTERRLASHGWTRFQMAMRDANADFLGNDMANVVADYGAPRHTAGYLVAFVSKVSDPAAYAEALGELSEATDNPGVLRLVALRTGSRAATHAVLVGGEDFASVNEYLDELFASDAFDAFASKVEGIREIVRVSAYRRLGAWGY